MSRRRRTTGRGGARRQRAALAVGALALALLAGCGGPGGRTSAAQDPRSRAQALIEAGNQAYRAGSYGLAARRYAAAAVIKTDDPAAYYGLGMALSKLGRDEDARTAYAQARALVQQARTPADTTE